MRTPFLAGLFLWAGLAAAQPSQYLDMVEATNRQMAAVRARAMGGLGHDNLACTVVNLTRKELRLRVRPGLRFESADEAAQDLFTFQEKLLVIKGHDSTRVRLRGFCMEKHNYSPRSNTVYAFRGPAGQGLQPLGDSLQKYPSLAEGYGQMFVWALSDNEPMHDVLVAPAQLRAATNVVRYISSVTGQQTTKALVARSPAEARPSVKTFAKRATLLYHSPRAQVATLRVYGADGAVVDELFKNRQLTPGVAHYVLGINMIMDADAVGAFTIRLLGPAGEVLKDVKVNDQTPEDDAAPTRQKFFFEFSLAKALTDAHFRIRLPNGTLVEELMQRPYLAAGKYRFQLAFNHLHPPGTAFVARLETAAGVLLHQQPITDATTP